MGLMSSKPTSVLQSASAHPNSYAIVTGATSGIGRDIANELCRRGFHLVIHGRNPDKVEALKAELGGKYPDRDIQGLIIDAAAAADSAFDAVSTITHLNIKLLVNNVGCGHNPVTDFITFTQQSRAQIARLIHVNVSFMTFFTHALLPTLQKSASKESPSFVINCGSLSELGLPWVSVYSGAKAYVSAFSKALDSELKGEDQHVNVISALIGDTDSDGHKVGTSLFTPSSERMACMIIDAAASRSGPVVRVPYLGHWFQMWLCKLQPYRLLQMGMIYNVKGLREKNGLATKQD